MVSVHKQIQRKGPRHYAEDLGWKKKHTPEGTVYSGSFRAWTLTFYGWIREDLDGKLHFFIHDPPLELLRDTSVFGCLHKRNDKWQFVTFKPYALPADVHSGIAAIQKALINAFQQRAEKRKTSSP